MSESVQRDDHRSSFHDMVFFAMTSSAQLSTLKD
jgi:hypothetical protein